MRAAVSGVLAGVLCLAVGLLAGRSLSPGRAEPEPAPSLPSVDEVTSLPSASREQRLEVAAAQDCTAEVATVRELLSECDAEREQLNLELYGEPIAWTDEIPANQREDAFIAIMDEVEDACGGRERTHLDCSEPPCMAVYFGGAPDVGESCTPWMDAYGVAKTNMTRTVECADGRERRITILSPTSQRYASVDDMFARGRDEDPAVREQRSTRLRARWEAMALDLPCPP